MTYYTRPISHSGLSTYLKCPRIWESIYILGEPRPEKNRASSRGDDIHAFLEAFFLGAPYPSAVKELRPWQRFMEALTVYEPEPEKKLAVDKEWRACDYDSPEAYFRGKLDLYYEDGPMVHIYDWKSGRIYEEDHRRQGESYVCISPVTDSYRTNFVYIDRPLIVHSTNHSMDTRKDLAAGLKEQIEVVRSAEEFPPTPSEYTCRYCHLSWRNGGKCNAAP